MTRRLTLKVTIKRNYGQHEISYGLEETVEVSNGDERRKAFQNLQSQLDDQINIYEAVYLPHIVLPTGQANNSSKSTQSDTFPAKTLIIEHKNGRRETRIKGGKWEKHGVPVYDECETLFHVEQFELGIHDISSYNLTATVDIVEGKAKRVRSLA